MNTTYTCGTRRNVRGNCGHTHRTIEAAVRCCRRDQAGCKKQGGYSDRTIIHSGGEPLSEDEYLYTQSPDCRI